MRADADTPLQFCCNTKELSIFRGALSLSPASCADNSEIENADAAAGTLEVIYATSSLTDM